MDTAYEKCLQKLIEENEKKGYLLFDDIIALTDKYELSLTDLDRINEDILLRGVRIFEIAPENVDDLSDDDSDKEADYSRVDYDQIYAEIIELEPGLFDLINYIKTIRPPQHSELKYLIERTVSGDKIARDRMINMYLRNVCKTALWYSKKYEINIWDAISAGVIGLINGVNNVSPNEELLFKTNLNFYIQNSIARECTPDWVDFYFPVHVKDVMFPEFIKFKEEHAIASYKDIDWSVLNYNKIYSSSNEYLRMALIQMSRESYEGIIEDGYDKETSFDMEEILENKANEELKNVIDTILGSLTEREREVLILRNGLNGNEPMTLEQVGERFNVTRERIRQIEVKAKRKFEIRIKNNNNYHWVLHSFGSETRSLSNENL